MLRFDELVNKGIFSKISQELSIADSLHEILTPDHPVSNIIYDREIRILEQYRDHIQSWDFARATIVRQQINEKIQQLVYERGN